MIVVDVVV